MLKRTGSTLARRAVFGCALLGATGALVAGGLAGGAALAYWGIRESRRYRVAGRSVLITGGSRGLGLALARQFLRRGAKVALLGRDVEALERARQLLAGKGTVFVRQCDVRDREQVEQAVADVRREIGEIDVLANNAGTITVGPMDAVSTQDYDEALNIFFWAPLYTTLAVLPSMRQRGTGRASQFKMGQTQMMRYTEPLLKRIQNGEIDPSFVVTHRLSLDEAPAAYRTFRDKQDQCIKVVLDPWRETAAA